ncbi:MAG: Flp family type IVb pilin [Gemmatimonadetes bacterium]|nr:Flp family type IVb pilin [Gemmatimonadota bacterium]
MRRFFRELWDNESGQDATEYVLLVVLIALAITAGMTVLATGINGAYSNASGTLNTTTSGGS